MHFPCELNMIPDKPVDLVDTLFSIVGLSAMTATENIVKCG